MKSCILISSILLFYARNILSYKNNCKHKGVIVALVKGEVHGDFYLLVRRNKSILQYFMQKNESESICNPDVVLFHEASLTENMQQYIQAQSPELPIIFSPIQFDGFAKYVNSTDKTSGFKQEFENCHPTGWSSSFKIGYKNMCRFWFIGFLEYVQQYSWMLRLDPDCEFEEESRNLLPPKDSVFISSPAWLPLHNQRFDKISTTYDGEVVKGMGPFVRKFIQEKISALDGGKTIVIDSWHAPYTNAMYMNLSMLFSNTTREAQLIWQFLRAVDDSNCIYTNRWGDMPLWGAVLGILDHPVHFTSLAYYHWSHKTIITSASKSGFFRKDIPNMLVFADHNNSFPMLRARVVTSALSVR